jgi:hypothetical protein
MSNLGRRLQRIEVLPLACAGCSGVCVTEARRLLETGQTSFTHCSCPDHDGCQVVFQVLRLRPTIRIVYDDDFPGPHYRGKGLAEVSDGKG